MFFILAACHWAQGCQSALITALICSSMRSLLCPLVSLCFGDSTLYSAHSTEPKADRRHKIPRWVIRNDGRRSHSSVHFLVPWIMYPFYWEYSTYRGCSNLINTPCPKGLYLIFSDVTVSVSLLQGHSGVLGTWRGMWYNQHTPYPWFTLTLPSP